WKSSSMRFAIGRRDEESSGAVGGGRCGGGFAGEAFLDPLLDAKEARGARGVVGPQRAEEINDGDGVGVGICGEERREFERVGLSFVNHRESVALELGGRAAEMTAVALAFAAAAETAAAGLAIARRGFGFAARLAFDLR